LGFREINMDDKLVTLEGYEVLYEAEFTKDLMEENGIKAMVVGEMLGGAYPYTTFGVRRSVIEVKIFAGDLDKAKDILKTQHDAENGED
jgi:hypothetical protein